jgi:hypothetical protein
MENNMKTLSVNDIINESAKEAGLKNEDVVMESATYQSTDDGPMELSWVTESVIRAIPSSLAAGMGAVYMRERLTNINEDAFSDTIGDFVNPKSDTASGALKKTGEFLRKHGKALAGGAAAAGAGAALAMRKKNKKQ